MRGSGQQKIGVAINFIAFCCLGLPLGETLTFFVFHEALGESKYYSFYFVSEALLMSHLAQLFKSGPSIFFKCVHLYNCYVYKMV